MKTQANGTRRKYRFLSLTMVVALVLTLVSGCGAPQTGSNSVSSQGDDSTSADTAVKTELDVGLKSEINGCHPYFNGTPSTAISGYICEPLTDRSPEGAVVPYVAKSWEMVDDRTWLFDLEEDIFFSNGEKLTAHSVV